MASIGANDKDIISIDRTTHRFKINYSKIKNMSIGEHVTSPTFKSAGYRWAIMFFPKGYEICNIGGTCRCTSLSLKLIDDHKGLDVSFALGLVRGDAYKTEEEHLLFQRYKCTLNNSQRELRLLFFRERSDLEKQFLTNGSFVIVCNINVNDKRNDELSQECYCGAREDLSKLFKTEEMADVKFEVEGEVFSAHRVILGAKSAVFKAELFGPMSETNMECIKIRDMKPGVFKALLQFVYTYSFPGDADTEMIQDLLVAADRYAIEGLIARCEQNLIENISLDRVLCFLICAERHNFSKLKSACLEMAVEQQNLNELALTEEYCAMMQEFPSLLADLRQCSKRRYKNDESSPDHVF